MIWVNLFLLGMSIFQELWPPLQIEPNDFNADSPIKHTDAVSLFIHKKNFSCFFYFNSQIVIRN